MSEIIPYPYEKLARDIVDSWGIGKIPGVTDYVIESAVSAVHDALEYGEVLSDEKAAERGVKLDSELAHYHRGYLDALDDVTKRDIKGIEDL
jgi:hypothetical protein